MSQLRLQLLGTFQILQNGRSLTAFRTDKIRALLAYLAVESGRPHRRESLAGLFWPEMDDQKALTNLRLSLHRLRQTLGNDQAILQIDRHLVGLDANQVRVDVLDFEGALTTVSRHKHPRSSACLDCCRRLETAVALYRGDFLPGFFLPEAAAFDDWAIARRQWLLQETLLALTMLADYHQENGVTTQAIPYVRRQLDLEPWRESAHRRLMQFLAQTGHYTAALNQYELCHRLLREELGVAPDTETTSLYQQIRAKRKTTLPEKESAIHPVPLSPAQQVTTFLPTVAAPFVGRQTELEKLDHFMAEPSVRLVTISGVGGIGKTRLALTCAASQAAHHPERFPHGVYFVPLNAVNTAQQLLSAIAHVLPIAPDQNDMSHTDAQQLLAYLQSRQLLLVLDNFEQLLDSDKYPPGKAILLNLLQHAPQLKLLITSRERLHLRMERCLPLDGLLCPDKNEADSTNFPAMQLFLQSARRIQPDFTITSDELPCLITICRLLDGIPLGLELAAAWIEWLPLAEIASEIQHNLDFLTTEMHDWPDRHRSMHSVFDASWERLSWPEQTLFQRLSLFRGGFTRAAVRAVAGGQQSPTAVLRLLSSLVGKSLLRYDRVTDRYTQHELLRQYGAEKLAQQSDIADLQQLHAAYYCRWLDQQASNFQGERQRETMARIKADLDNIRAAWNWAAQTGLASLLADAAFSLGLYFLRRGRHAEGLEVFSSAIQRLESSVVKKEPNQALSRLWYWQAIFEPAFPSRQQYLERSLALLAGVNAPERASSADKAAALLELGIVAKGLGNHDVADQQFKQSLTLYRLAGSQWGEANVLFELGVRAWRTGDYPLAEQWFSHCLHLRRRLGDVVGIATALEGLAGTAMFSGHTKNAIEYLGQSYTAYEQLADRGGMARLKIKQAQIDWYQNLEGLALFEEGLAILNELGARRNVALWTVIFAMLQADEDIEIAAKKAEEGQKLCQELGHRRGVAIAQGVLSRVALVNGRYQEALELAEAYLHTAQALSLAIEYSDALIWSSWANLALGNIQQAERYAAEALQTPHYWRVSCLDLTAVLLAHRSAKNYEYAWQILSFAESRYARHRGVVSQNILHRFMPGPMQIMPSVEIAGLREQGLHLNGESLYREIRSMLL